MMTIGVRLVQIFHRTGGYQVQLPIEPTLTNAVNHLRELEPHVRANLVVVTLEAVELKSADEAIEADRDTEPGPMSAAAFHALLGVPE